MTEKLCLHLPNQETKTFLPPLSGYQIKKHLSNKEGRKLLCIKVNGTLKDLSYYVTGKTDVEPVFFDTDEGKEIYWHSTSHLMAHAIEELYPGTKFGAGPAIENGFYYDIDSPHIFKEQDLEKIEERMIEISQRDYTIERREIPRTEAIEYFKTKRKDPYKIEILQETLASKETVSIYSQGDFSDLCAGPHIHKTSLLKFVKLTNISTSFWRGDSKRKKMQRIYGISFPSKKELDQHFSRLEEAKKRDHRKIGTELELFYFASHVGKGLPIWLPNGATLRAQLENFLTKVQRDEGYLPVITPHVGSLKLYETSGHYPYYKESQFPPISFQDEAGEVETYLLKPMNCPHHHKIFSSKIRSYRDLPLRLAEFGTVYRYEQSGELNGLLRARTFTQDDAHIYCRQDQLESEVCSVIRLTKDVFKYLGFSSIEVRLSFRNPSDKKKYGGHEDQWNQAETDIKQAADKMDLKYRIGIGEASFYGPKIDFIIKDAIGRKWQLGTVQVDYVMPERFDLSYINSKGQQDRPVIIHRAPFGSLERIVAIMTEHFSGNFPVWLAPNQVIILSVSENISSYGDKIFKQLLSLGVRAKFDSRNEKISKKIKQAELAKIPYMFVLGEKEQESNTVSVRKRFSGNLGVFNLEKIIDMIQTEIDEKSLLINNVQ